VYNCGLFQRSTFHQKKRNLHGIENLSDDKTPRRGKKKLRKGDRAYYDTLSESELDELWARRADLGLTDIEEKILRFVLRERKGFKPVEVHVSICQRCNLPADNCACLNL